MQSLLLTKTAGAALAAGDPFQPIIGALNSYLHAYHMYRAEALRVLEIERLDTMSRNALDTLQLVFPYGVRSKNGTFRSWFCTEKPHSMTHWTENYASGSSPPA